MALRALALAALPEEPWLNGGGRTRTLATRMRHAADVQADLAQEPPWDWRISVATVERSGPFSVFAGVDRCSMLLGAGRLELSADGELPVSLQHPGDHTAYRGDVVWQAEVDGDGPPCTLLNVMTRRGTAQARLTTRQDAAVLSGHDIVVLVIGGRWRVVDALPGAEPDQGVLLGAGHGAWSELPSPRSTARWCLDRASPSGALVAVEIDRITRPSVNT